MAFFSPYFYYYYFFLFFSVFNGGGRTAFLRVIYVGNRLEFFTGKRQGRLTPSVRTGGMSQERKEKKKTVDKIFITTTKTARAQEERRRRGIDIKIGSPGAIEDICVNNSSQIVYSTNTRP